MQRFSLQVNEHYGDGIINLSLPETWSLQKVEMNCKELYSQTMAVDRAIGHQKNGIKVP